MSDLAGRALPAWQGFYQIVGTSAAALIGIQFVVITLIATMRRPATADSISAFGTPTVVQFASTLLVAALLNVPWPSLFPLSIALAMCGLGGLAYGAIAIRRARRQTYYLPEPADWLRYALFPCSAYAILLVSAAFLGTATSLALCATGVASLGLLLIGIHNAWDAVTHMVVGLHDDAKD